MATDDLRERLHYAMRPGLAESVLDRLEAVARAHASERIEAFAAGAEYCPFCGAHADEPHTADCPAISPLQEEP